MTVRPARPETDAPPVPEAEFWNEPLQAVMARLATSPAGLSPAEADKRLDRYGRNVVVATHRMPAWRQFLRRLGNPLILILLLASGLSAMAGDVTSFVIVSVIVLFSVGLDFIQERHAEHTIDALASSVAVRADVIRDGKTVEVPVELLVPGDIVCLGAGDLVPADCRLFEARDFSVNQALLTGESFPAEKQADDLGGKAHNPGEAANSIFFDTAVVTGSARAVVCLTGKATALGHLAGMLREPAPANAFELGIQRFGMLMLRLTIFTVLFVLATNALFDRPWLQSLMFALALAVALTPELLPAIITVTLARGAQHLAKRKVVVKQLAAIHNLGSMDVLCTDKTGTLTEARIEIARHVDHAGQDSERVLAVAYLNSHFSNGVQSPLDRAILDHGGEDTGGWSKLDEVPFDYVRRRVSLLVEKGPERLLVVKGAPEDVLRACTSYEVAVGDCHSLDDATRSHILDLFRDLSGQGFRVLAVAWRTVSGDISKVAAGDETGLVFLGFVAFFDPPKASAGAAVKELAELGVGLKILTGDTELVTRHLCAELGIIVTDLATGDELDGLSEAALIARIERTNVFCRMVPHQKQRVIAALKRRGRSVGYLGDGVNDAPALHAADVGISIDSAVGVAKEAATVILLEHDLSVVRQAVIEGRRAVQNTTKYILMGTSSNFGNMLSMAGAALVLPILPMLPVQVLLNNLLYDVSELGLPFDNVDDEAIRRPVRWDLGLIKRFMLVLAPVSSLFDFLTFFVLLRFFHAGAAEFQTGWFVESLATQALVIFAIRSRKSLFRSRPAPILTVLTVALVIIGAILPLTVVGAWFGFVHLPLSYYAFLAGAVVAYLSAVQLVKRRLLQPS